MRNYAQIQLSIWNDDDFRALSPGAQHLYFLLLSSPTLSQCGVGDWRPARFARYAHGWSQDAIWAAATELIAALFILVDVDTEEYLVRTYVRNDGVMKQPNMGVSMARGFAEVGSQTLRGVVVHELRRLRDEHPELKGFSPREVVKTLEKPPIDPSTYPFGDPSETVSEPIEKGSIDPSVDPSKRVSLTHPKSFRNPSVDPSTDPSVDPSPIPVPVPVPTSKAGNRKGKGGLGERGNPDVVQAAESSPPIDPPDSLDALAAAHAASRHDPERCDAHQGIAEENVPNCWACANARKTHRAKLDAEAKQAGQSRRAQIDACDMCDDNGWILIDGVATKCTHHHERKSA